MSFKYFCASSMLAVGLAVSPVGAEEHDRNSQVREAQQALKDKGVYEGQVDGINGPQTRAAIEEYQRDEGLTVTGRLDARTRDHMGIKATTSATGGNTPVDGAEAAARGGIREGKRTVTQDAPNQVDRATDTAQEGYQEGKKAVTKTGRKEVEKAGSAVKGALGEIKGATGIGDDEETRTRKKKDKNDK